MSQWFFAIPTPGLRRAVEVMIGARARSLAASRSTLTATIRLWRARRRQRRHLGEVAQWNDHLLKDIGVSRDTALAEAAKPFWRP